MYSYADRIRAVELYIKLGKRLMATIRQLGYPTKNALRGWHREYEQRLDLPGLCCKIFNDHKSTGSRRKSGGDCLELVLE
ncbi:transposase-like protein [Phyllobacterium trifolii]|uniref:Transposase-like protein n=1 Tax=Phyllobacterium trifolii TaxID=300193 RepID=A0A839UIW6_9HYPH|nr:transposase-like protein [Phyllobacterium trifolii]